MEWINNQLDMEKHCKKFLKVCNKIGGSCIPASKTLKCQWIESVYSDPLSNNSFISLVMYKLFIYLSIQQLFHLNHSMASDRINSVFV